MIIFSKALKLKMLDKKVSSSLGLINTIVTDLEKTNNKFEKVRAELETDIIVAREHHMRVLDAMVQNKKVIQNFKNLLK